MITSVSELSKGLAGTISHLEGEFAAHLLALGFTPGCQVRKVSSGPFRDPAAYAIRGTTFALRRAEAACIKLNP